MFKRLLILCLASTSLLFAQAPLIEVSSMLTQGSGTAPDTFRVYLSSLTGSNINVRSATLTILHNSSCASYSGLTSSHFRNLWAGFFESVQVQTLQNPAVGGGNTFNQRLLYGNTSATVPPVYVVVPPAPATVEVLEFTFNGACTDRLYIEDRSEYLLNSIGDPNNNNIPFRVNNSVQLPVEYLNLEAEAVSSDQVEVRWTTAREMNSAYFEVEKSFDEDFAQSEVIGKVQAAVVSESPTAYQFTDRGNMASVVYYRLRQVDLDGAEYLSRSLSVNFVQELTAVELKAYPNPFAGRLTVDVTKGNLDAYTLQVIDLTGKVHFERLQEDTGALEDSWTLDLSHLPSGYYILHIPEANARGKVNLIKQ